MGGWFSGTPDTATQNMGVVNDDAMTYGDHSTVLENLQSGFDASRTSSETGELSLMSEALDKRAEQVEALTGFRPTVYNAEPDLSPYRDWPKTTPPGQEIEQEKKLDDLRAQGYDIPSRDALFDNVKKQVLGIRAEASDVAERSPGASGWAARTVGGIAGFPLAHPVLAGAGLIAPFEGIAARLGWAGLQNGTTTLAASYLDGKRQEKEFGEPFDEGQAWREAGYGALFGILAEGAVAGGGKAYGHYFPDRTTQSAAEVGQNLGDLAKQSTPEGKVAADLTAAKTPADAVQATTGAPTPVLADLLYATDKEPTTGVRALQQGAEHEILAEASQPEGVAWGQHVENLSAVAKAVENGTPMPNLTPVESVHTPMDDLLDRMRKGAATTEKQPNSLLQFLASRGGLNDESGELAAMDADKWHVGKPFQRKLVTEDGENLDDAALAAHEAGYFPAHGDERPTVDDLLEAIDKELRGKKIYPNHEDVAGAPDVALRKQMDQFLNENGLSLDKNSNDEIKQALAAAQQSQAPHLQAAAHEETNPIGEREHSDIEREMKELHEGVEQVQKIKSAPEAATLGDDLKRAIIQKFGKYDPEAVVPLGPISLNEKGELQMPQMKLKDLLESIESDHEVLKAMTTCMR